MTDSPICVRWTFAPDRAAEFLDKILVNGQESQPQVAQIEYDSIDEIMEVLHAFDDAILDASALINGRVVNLSDHPLADENA